MGQFSAQRIEQIGSNAPDWSASTVVPSCATLHVMAPSYYEILQVGPDASQAEIAASYRKLARKLHPDLNPAPDAHAQMQRLNEAYNTLRHLQQRQRYDEALGLPLPTAHPPATGGPEGRADGPKGSSRRSWLSYQKQVGDVVVLAIGEAENLAELLAELQQRIPENARSYDIVHNRWQISARYADVLRTLFGNYAPVVLRAEPSTATGRPVRAQPAGQPARLLQRPVWTSFAVVLVGALALYGLLLGQVLLSDTGWGLRPTATLPAPNAVDAPQQSASQPLLFPEDCTVVRLDGAPLYFQEACKTLAAEARPTATQRVRVSATTRVSSNIRSGPDTRFPVLATTAPGAQLQLVGYTVNQGYVWFLTSYGGWIRGDLLTEPPGQLPEIGS